MTDLDDALRALGRGAADRAVDPARRAVEAAPNDAEAMAVYGLARCLVGDPQGFTDLARAVAAEPREPRWRLYQANALAAAGRAAEAATVLSQAASMSDYHPAVVLPQVTSLAKRGDGSGAFAAARRALRARPAEPAYLRLVASLGPQAQAHADAYDAAARLAAATEASQEDRLRFAGLAMDLSRYEEAYPLLERLHDQGAGPAASLRLARLHAFAGRFAQSEAVLRQALRSAPADPTLLTLLLGLPGSTAQDAEASIAVVSDTPNKALRLAIARTYLRQGDAERSIRHARIAHQGAPAWAAEATVRHRDWAFQAADCARKGRAGAAEEADAPRLIYLCGPPRSGGSLLQTILCANYDAASVGERGSLPLAFLQAEASGQQTIERDALHAADLAGLRRQVPGSTAIVDKTPQNGLVAGLIAAVHPGARFVRNARDRAETALSIWLHDLPPAYGYAGRLTEISQYLRLHDDTMDRWEEAGVAFEPVSHEAVVTGDASERLAARLGLRPSREEAAIYVPTHSFAQVREAKALGPARLPLVMPHLTAEEQDALGAI